MEEGGVESGQAIGGHAPKLAQRRRLRATARAGPRGRGRAALARRGRPRARRAGAPAGAASSAREQVERDAGTVSRSFTGAVERARAGERREVVEAHLDADRAPAALLARRAWRRARSASCSSTGSSASRPRRSSVERGLARLRLGHRATLEPRSSSKRARRPRCGPQPGAEPARPAARPGVAPARPSVVMPCSLEALDGLRPDAGDQAG